MPAAPARVAASGTSSPRPGASQDAAAAYRQHAASSYVQASAAGSPVTTAFPEGDLPLLTASGADPALPGRLPWQARWAAARASRPDLTAMLSEYQCSFGDDMAAVHAMSGGPFYADVQACAAQVSNWIVGADREGYNGPGSPDGLAPGVNEPATVWSRRHAGRRASQPAPAVDRDLDGDGRGCHDEGGVEVGEHDGSVPQSSNEARVARGFAVSRRCRSGSPTSPFRRCTCPG